MSRGLLLAHAQDVKSPPGSCNSADGGVFATTRWNLIIGGGAAEDKMEALAHVAHSYWRPIYAIIFRRGYSSPDAQDLTQDFFLALARGPLLQVADPGRGRFRSLLLRALQNFLADQSDKRGAAKRGGGIEFLPWRSWMEGGHVQLPISPQAMVSWPDEKIFDAGWAASVAAAALCQLKIDYESEGRRKLFEELSGHITAGRCEVSYSALGERLGVTEESIKRLLRQMRLRYRIHLRNEVAATLQNPADVEDELRYLCAALCAAS